MKKFLSLTLAALLLLSLIACGEVPAPNSSEPAQTDVLSPITTEEEVLALYANDEDITGITVDAYQGDFLVTLDNCYDVTILDWVYGQSGIRRRMLWLYEPIISCKIKSQASVQVVTGGSNNINGVPSFPHVETVALNLLYDDLGRGRGYDPYGSPDVGSREVYWAGAGESYGMGMQGRREAIRSAQIDAGGLTVAFAPLADGSDFIAAYCEIPYTVASLSEDGMTLTITMHDTFLDCGKLEQDMDTTFLKDYGSLYPESFPAGELAGSCILIEKAELHQDGDNAVLTVALADGPIHGKAFGDGYYRFTMDHGYTGIADIGPYLQVKLNATNDLFENG